MVILTAPDYENAIACAEREARSYANQNNGCTYCEFVNVYLIGGGNLGHLSEVYSLMRRSDLDTDDYLNRFIDTGSESVGSSPQKHSGSYLSDILIGLEPMTRTLAETIWKLRSLEKLSFEALARNLCSSELSNAQSFQIGEGLWKKATIFLDLERESN